MNYNRLTVAFAMLSLFGRRRRSFLFAFEDVERDVLCMCCTSEMGIC
jgi:hypothetical protein